MAPAADAPVEDRAGEHLVEFYEQDELLAGEVARFIAPALHGDDAAIIVATPGHLGAFEAALATSGVDVPLAMAAGRYQSFDAADLLATFMVHGAPDWGRFRRKSGGAIERITMVGGGLR